MATGYLHSIETFATLDGGGIRFAVFLQGCPLRCVYCHNPDSQAYFKGNPTSSDELVNRIERRKNYYKNGGVTITGGEPLAQPEFLQELLQSIKSRTSLHTAVDTSLCGIPQNFDQIAALADLFIVDLKFATDEMYHTHTGGNIKPVLDGIKLLNQLSKPVLLRTVIVPGINDTEACLEQYLPIAQSIMHLTRYELLGYHTMGDAKYQNSGRQNPLQGVPAMDVNRLTSLQAYIDKRLR